MLPEEIIQYNNKINEYKKILKEFKYILSNQD